MTKIVKLFTTLKSFLPLFTNTWASKITKHISVVYIGRVCIFKLLVFLRFYRTRPPHSLTRFFGVLFWPFLFYTMNGGVTLGRRGSGFVYLMCNET